MSDLKNQKTVKKGKTKTTIITLMLLIGSAGLIYSSNAATTEPGSSSDPLVTRSYVDSKISELKALITGSSQNSSEEEVEQQNSMNIDEIKKYIDDNTMDISELQKYIDENATSMEDIKNYIDASLASGNTETNENVNFETNSNPSTNTNFIVIEMQPDSILSCEASAEVILRAGTARAIGNTSGDGLTDVTAGQDIKDGQPIQKNHLIIVPRSDGRGLKFESKSYIMVKGNYSIH